MTGQRPTKGAGPQARASQLVAHRGYARRYPENTLEAVEAAWRAGARYIEVDVQMTSDGVPVLLHDSELHRTTGAEGRITETSFERVSALRAGEPERFGARFADVRLPALAELAQWLATRPDTRAFVEIKRESLEAFDIETVLARVIRDLSVVLERCVLISSQRVAMDRARVLGVPRIGWVLPEYSMEWLAAAEADKPDFLFLNHTRLPPAPEPLRTGPWCWVLYEIDDPDTALALIRRGAHMIETMAIGELLSHPAWRGEQDHGG